MSEQAPNRPRQPEQPAASAPAVPPQPPVTPPEGDPEIANTPLRVPGGARDGGEEWVPKGKEGAGGTLSARPQDPYSTQSRQLIAAIEEQLRNPDCTQIDGYGPGKISAQIRGGHALFNGQAFRSAEEYEAWLKGLVETSTSPISWERIQEQGTGVVALPGGERLAIALPPVAFPHATFSLRKHTAIEWSSEEFVTRGTCSPNMLKFLLTVVASHVNILFVGEMGAGKSTMLRALLQDAAGDNERIAVVEQVPELFINKPLVIHQLYQPTIEKYSLHEVLDFDLYKGLDRLIVGEVHSDGITKMLETMIVTAGSMSTYHAMSTELAGARMKVAVQMERSNLSAATAAEYIRHAVELVVVLERDQTDGTRRVMQISEIDWRTSSGNDQLTGSDLFVYDRDRGIYKPTGSPIDAGGRIAKKLNTYGMKVNPNWFISDEMRASAARAGIS